MTPSMDMYKPALLDSSTPDFHSRVVNVASSAHRAQHLSESDNYNFQKGGYHYGLAYANSKLATIYMANKLDRRYGHRGLHATSLHPGGININLSRNLGSEFAEQIMSIPNVFKIMKTPEQGAATTVLAAVGKAWEDKGGKYLEDCEEGKRGEDDNDTYGVGYVRQTYDPRNEERLWKDSLKIVGMNDDM
jgi:NAD(P)-dependent dehydrogenase (short-subunit alcohol dehydrogenase family)